MKLFLSIFLTLAIFAVATLGVSKKRSFNFSTSWGKRAATGSSKPDMESGAKGQNQKCSFNFSSSWGKRAGKTTNSESESINDYALIDQTYLEQLIAKQNVSKSSHFFKKNNYNTQIKSKQNSKRRSPTEDPNVKVEKILKGRLDSILFPSSSLKIQIMGGKICLRRKGETLHY